MGSSVIYKSLQEIFPEVDARLLKAVAIEHPKNTAEAVEVLLTEVIPCMSERSNSSCSQSENLCPTDPSEGEEDMDPDSTLVRRRVRKSSSCENSSDANATGANNADSASTGNNSIEHIVLGEDDKLTSFVMLGETNDEVGLDHDANVDQQSSVNVQSRKLIPMNKSEDINVRKTANVTTIYADDDHESVSSLYTGNWPNWEGSDKNSILPLKLCALSSQLAEYCASQQTLSSVEDAPDAAESGLQPDSGSHTSDCGSGSCSFNSNEGCSENGVVNIDDDTALVGQSRQICRVDLLERIIEDAKNNKKTLFSAMESLINLMKKVELQEEAAEQAREEAAKGGSDILIKVEEIRKMLLHAKEGNDMHAGEVYAEKAILTTEVRELQTRLLSSSHERDASIAILNEMRETLESRLASAEEVIRAALLEKQEKEESAKNALREQEVFMEKVVQEYRILEQQAAENSKLQEFLMDRGLVVDMLQGEISVICQDVKALKESFDKRIPLSQSFTSTQTTCKLASSNASIKSVVSDLDQGLPKTSEETSPTTSMINGESPKGHTTTILHTEGMHLEDTLKNQLKALVEDGWDFLESVQDIETIHN